MKRALLILGGCSAGWAVAIAAVLVYAERRISQVAGWLS